MSLSTPLLRWLTLLSPVCCCLFAARGILHYFQLESYQFPGYFRSLKRNRVHSLLPGLCATAAVLVLLYGFDVLALRGGARWAGILAAVLLLPLSAGAGLAIGRAFSPRRAKKKFVITGRVKRLYAVFFSGDDAHQRPDGAGAMGGLSRAVAAFAAAGCRACGAPGLAAGEGHQ